MRLIAAGLVAFLLAAMPMGVAASPEARDAPASEAPQPRPEKAKRICRSTPVTGQRVPRRECKTAADWANADALRDDTDALRVKSATPVGSLPGGN